MTETPETDTDVCGYEDTTTGRPCQRPASYADGRCYQHTTESTETPRVKRLFDRLQDIPVFKQLGDIDSESDTAYNGPFSYGVEVHAFFFGAALGAWYVHDPAALNWIAAIIITVFTGERAANRSTKVPAYIVRQAREEMHYFMGGVVGGAVLLKHFHGWGSYPVVRLLDFLRLA